MACARICRQASAAALRAPAQLIVRVPRASRADSAIHSAADRFTHSLWAFAAVLLSAQRPTRSYAQSNGFALLQSDRLERLAHTPKPGPLAVSDEVRPAPAPLAQIVHAARKVRRTHTRTHARMNARTHARTRTCSPSPSLGPAVSCLFWVGQTRKAVLLGSSQQLPEMGAEMGAANDGCGTKRRRASRDAVNAHGVRPPPISGRLSGDTRKAPTRTYLRALTEYATATATAAKPIQTNKPTRRAVHSAAAASTHAVAPTNRLHWRNVGPPVQQCRRLMD